MSRDPVPAAKGSRHPALLTVSELVLDRGADRILDHLSFEVVRGSTTAVIGANGAGKTSLIRAITGLVTPSGGSIRFLDRELIGRSSAGICELGIAQLPEGRQLFPTMSVRENLEIGAALPRARAGGRRRLERLLALFPRLAAQLDCDAGTLSVGEQLMLAFGRCLMAAPELILIDEPTRGLTPAFARQLYQLIGTLEAEGVTIILADQHPAAALRLADAAHVLDRGRIVRSGPGLELLAEGRRSRDG